MWYVRPLVESAGKAPVIGIETFGESDSDSAAYRNSDSNCGCNSSNNNRNKRSVKNQGQQQKITNKGADTKSNPKPHRLRIECQAGDILMINTRLWWHQTELPDTTYATTSINTTASAGPPLSLPLSMSYARDFHCDAAEVLLFKPLFSAPPTQLTGILPSSPARFNAVPPHEGPIYYGVSHETCPRTAAVTRRNAAITPATP